MLKTARSNWGAVDEPDRTRRGRPVRGGFDYSTLDTPSQAAFARAAADKAAADDQRSLTWSST